MDTEMSYPDKPAHRHNVNNEQPLSEIERRSSNFHIESGIHWEDVSFLGLSIFKGMHDRVKQIITGFKNICAWYNNEQLATNIRSYGYNAPALVFGSDGLVASGSILPIDTDAIASMRYILPDNPGKLNRNRRVIMGRVDFFTDIISHRADQFNKKFRSDISDQMNQYGTHIQDANTYSETNKRLIPEAVTVGYGLLKILRHYLEGRNRENPQYDANGIQEQIAKIENTPFLETDISRRGFIGGIFAAILGAEIIQNEPDLMGVAMTYPPNEPTKEFIENVDSTLNMDLYNGEIAFNGRTAHIVTGTEDIPEIYGLPEGTVSVGLIGHRHNAMAQEYIRDKTKRDEALFTYCQLVLYIARKVYAHAFRIPEQDVSDELLDLVWRSFVTIDAGELIEPRDTNNSSYDPNFINILVNNFSYYEAQVSPQIARAVIDLRPLPNAPLLPITW